METQIGPSNVATQKDETNVEVDSFKSTKESLEPTKDLGSPIRVLEKDLEVANHVDHQQVNTPSFLFTCQSLIHYFILLTCFISYFKGKVRRSRPRKQRSKCPERQRAC